MLSHVRKWIVTGNGVVLYIKATSSLGAEVVSAPAQLGREEKELKELWGSLDFSFAAPGTRITILLAGFQTDCRRNLPPVEKDPEQNCECNEF